MCCASAFYCVAFLFCELMVPSYPHRQENASGSVPASARHGAVLRRAVRRPAPALAVRDPDPDAPRRPRRRCGDACPAGATSRSPRRHGLCSGEGHRVDQGELNLLTHLLTFDWAYTHYYLGYHGYTHRRSPGKRRRSRLQCAPPRRAGGSLPWTRRPASTTTRPPPKRCGARTLATPAAPACRAPRTVTRPTLRTARLDRSPRRSCLPVVRRGTYVTQLPPVQVQRAKVQTLLPLQAAMKAAAAAAVSIVVHGIVHGIERRRVGTHPSPK